jgi:hypothetical protein
MRKKINTILASSTIACAVAAVSIPRAGATAFIDGCAWGCCLILVDTLLFYFFTTRKIASTPMSAVWAYLISAAVRFPLIVGIFLLLVMRVRVDGLGLMVGITVTLVTVMTFAMRFVFRDTRSQEAVS